MPSEEQERSDPELVEFANHLANISLGARVPNRDELMYRCGEASVDAVGKVGGHRRAEDSRRAWAGSGGLTMAVTLMAVFSLGAVAGHFGTNLDTTQASRPTSPSSRLGNQPINQPDNPDRSPTPLHQVRTQSRIDQRRLADIQSGKYLYTSIDSRRVERLTAEIGTGQSGTGQSGTGQSGTGQSGTGERVDQDVNSLRAGAAGRMLDEL